MTDFWERVFAVFFPERCLFCDKVIRYRTCVCESCRSQMRPHLSLGQGMDALDGFLSVYPYKDQAREAVLSLKFHNRPDLANPMGDLLWEFGRDVLDQWGIHMLTFVPMHPVDREERGYNQARLLAVRLSRRSGLPVHGTLVKTRQTKKQHDLSAIERKTNLLDVYQGKEEMDLQHQTILLVDDVITTGSTVKECAKVLKAHGAQRVFALSFAGGRGDEAGDT